MKHKNKFRRNITLDYIQLGLRSFNVTNVIWLIYLALKGFTALEIGIFESLFHVSSIGVEVPSGIVADLIGRKKARIIGILLYLIYIVLMIYTNSFIFIGLAFIICGASYAFESGSGEALIYDSLKKLQTEDQYMKISGNREIIFQMSSSIALFIGGYLALIDYKLNFLIVFIGFIMALIPILMMEETGTKSNESSLSFIQKMNKHFIESTKTVFSNKNLRFLVILGAFLAAPVTSVFFYFQLYLSETLQYSEIYIGILLAAHSIAGALGGYFAVKLERKYSESLLLYVVPLILVLSFWVIQIDLVAFLPFILLGFLDSVIYIVIMDYTNRFVTSEQRATVLSISSLAFSVVMILMFPLVGAVATYYSFKFSFMILSMILTISYLILMFTLKRQKFNIKKEV